MSIHLIEDVGPGPEPYDYGYGWGYGNNIGDGTGGLNAAYDDPTDLEYNPKYGGCHWPTIEDDP